MTVIAASDTTFQKDRVGKNELYRVHRLQQ